MIRRVIKRSDFVRDEYLGWNAFIDLIAMEDYDELTEVQRTAHLVFWYDSEVQNGGHLQYYANSSGKRATETMDALSKLRMECQLNVLSDAIALISKNPLNEITSVDQYVAEALENKFGDLDSRYYSCSKEATDFLEEYLERNFDEFIELV